MAYALDIETCLINAERRIADAANGFQIVLWTNKTGEALAAIKKAARADMIAYEREAREFYAEAAKTGWDGDVDALISHHWAVYLPQVDADMIVKARELALEESQIVA